MIDVLLDFLKKNDVYYEIDFELSAISYIKIGGSCKVAVFPSRISDFVSLIDLALDNELPFIVLGAMSNVLPSDNHDDRIFIFTSELTQMNIDGLVLRVECGVKMSRAIWQCAMKGVGGLEDLFMIPGTAGGMVYQNAGAYTGCIADRFIHGLFYDCVNRRIIRLYNGDLKFSYRSSVLQNKRFIMLECSFLLQSKEKSTIINYIKEIASKRRASQPVEYPSLGSVFRRESDAIPARLIDMAGLKGYRINDSVISEKHAGFIINIGSAKCRDVVELIDYAKKIVFVKFGVHLKEEIEFLT